MGVAAQQRSRHGELRFLHLVFDAETVCADVSGAVCDGWRRWPAVSRAVSWAIVLHGVRAVCGRDFDRAGASGNRDVSKSAHAVLGDRGLGWTVAGIWQI